VPEENPSHKSILAFRHHSQEPWSWGKEGVVRKISSLCTVLSRPLTRRREILKGLPAPVGGREGA